MGISQLLGACAGLPPKSTPMCHAIKDNSQSSHFNTTPHKKCKGITHTLTHTLALTHTHTHTHNYTWKTSDL